jgi:hypothetical protein
MTPAETEQRLADAERELSELRIAVAELRAVLLLSLEAESPDEKEVLDHVKEVISERPPRDAVRGRPRLRSVPRCGDSAPDMDEALRRARAGGGGGR